MPIETIERKYSVGVIEGARALPERNTQISLFDHDRQEIAVNERQQASRSRFNEVARAERAETASELNRVKSKIGALREEEQKLEERMEHLNALLGDAVDDEATEKAAASPEDAANLVIEILKNDGGAMHFREIYEEFVKQGGSIGGKDPANNLLTKFYDDPRVRRTARGTYELTDPPREGGLQHPRTPSPN